MIKKILPLLLVLFLGCSSDSDNNADECTDPHTFRTQSLNFRFIDHATGVDVIASGALSADQLKAVNLQNNQEMDLPGFITSDPNVKGVIFNLPYTDGGSFSYQIKRDGANFFILSFDITQKQANCIITISPENFDIDNYQFDTPNLGSYRIYL